MSKLAQVPALLAYKDKDLRLVEYSDTYRRYSGTSSLDELVGKRDEDIIEHDYLDIYHEQEINVINGKTDCGIYPAIGHADRHIYIFQNKQPGIEDEKIIAMFI